MRFKFVCTHVNRESYQVGLTPGPVGAPENRQAFGGVPIGQIMLTGLAPEVWHKFEAGKAYLLDFTPAPLASPPAVAAE